MDLQVLQKAKGERGRAVLTSLLAIVLALTALLVLGLVSRPHPLPAAEAHPLPQVAVEPASAGLPSPMAVPAQATMPLEQTAWPPVGEDSPTQGSTFLVRLQQMLLVLTLVSLLVWAFLRLAGPKMAGLAQGTGAQRRLLNVLERHTLGPGRGLLLVEVAGRHLLLGTCEHGVQTLAELSAAEIQAAREEASASRDGQPGRPPAEAPKNLVQEVLAQHLSALPTFSSRQRGP